ncbi:MAG: HD domain-containing phosphohydrolase [Planctomycetota bacterium]
MTRRRERSAAEAAARLDAEASVDEALREVFPEGSSAVDPESLWLRRLDVMTMLVIDRGPNRLVAFRPSNGEVLTGDLTALPMVRVGEAERPAWEWFDSYRAAFTTGWTAGDADGGSLFVGRRASDADVVFAVLTPEAGIEERVQAAAWWVLELCAAGTAGVLALSGLCLAWIVNQIKRRLRHVEHEVRTAAEADVELLARSRHAIVFGLAKLSESRQRDNGMHLQRVRSYATILATEMARNHKEIDADFVENLSTAAALHDIGMAAIPDSLLQKQGPLTPSERRAVRLHTLVGAECLASAQRQAGRDSLLQLAEQIALSHHEHWDGGGYPHGLQGPKIPMGARIAAVADVYDALTTRRPYREAKTHVEARDYIAGNYGTIFDPAVVEAFIERQDDFLRVFEATEQESAPESKNLQKALAAELELDPASALLASASGKQD